MVTLGKSGTISDRRLAVGALAQREAAKILFTELAPVFKDRRGGYTRIIRMNERQGDAAQLAILEWVDAPVEAAPSSEDKKAESDKAGEETRGTKKTKKGKEAQETSPEAKS